jgi:3-isopropylmalate/(R)-2-methylmalate dehydratase large subunit
VGKTISEKIISEHAGRDVKPGEFVVAKVDVVMAQDGTGPLSVQELQKMNMERVFDKENSILFIDHASPSSRKELSNSQKLLREFSEKTGAFLSDIGEGVCHQRLVEDWVNPGILEHSVLFRPGWDLQISRSLLPLGKSGSRFPKRTSL